jgi:ribosomal protein S27AE
VEVSIGHGGFLAQSANALAAVLPCAQQIHAHLTAMVRCSSVMFADHDMRFVAAQCSTSLVARL